MTKKQEYPETGERFIIGRSTSRRVGIIADTTAVIQMNGKMVSVTTPGITIAFKEADRFTWDSAKAEDVSGRTLTPEEVEIVRLWAIENIVGERPKVFGFFMYSPERQAEELKEHMAAEQEKESRFVSGTRTSETVKAKGRKG